MVRYTEICRPNDLCRYPFHLTPSLSGPLRMVVKLVADW